MDYRTFEQFQDEASSAGVLFYYTGPFDSEVIAALASQLKDTLQKKIPSGPASRKLFSIFIEMAQNVLHYGSATPRTDSDVPTRPGSIVLGKGESSYWIVCANLVASNHVPRIRSRLEALRNMSVAEVKAAYRAQLANDEHAETDTLSKGAGLGLLTIARESAQPIEFDFAPDPASDGRFSMFRIRTVI
jgi:hypothetical protein